MSEIFNENPEGLNFKTEKPQNPEQKEHQKRGPKYIEFPAAEVILKKYSEKYPGEKERLELIRDFYQDFLQQEIASTKIFKSEKYGASVPYNSIKIGDFAKKLYKKYSGKDLPASLQDSPVPIKQEFIYGTSISSREGDGFTFIEEVVHQFSKHLPTALKDIQASKAPEEREFFMIGLPTNVLGSISADFAKKAAGYPFDELAKVYSELVHSKIENAQTKPEHVEIYGMSLGANLAVRTSERLIEERIVTQDLEVAQKEKIPYLQIRAEVPVSLSPSKRKKWQIPFGYVVDVFRELRLPEVQIIEKGRKKFYEQVDKALAARGIKENMSAEQKKLKQKTIVNIILALGRGLTPKPETKITEIYGLQDATTNTAEMTAEAEQRREDQGFRDKFGKFMLGRKHTNRRAFTADMLHLNPRFRENEVRRLRALAETIESIKS